MGPQCIVLENLNIFGITFFSYLALLPKKKNTNKKANKCGNYIIIFFLNHVLFCGKSLLLYISRFKMFQLYKLNKGET
jgi:hypothetical protein